MSVERFNLEDTMIAPTAIERLTKDLRTATATLTVTEVRFLVDSYYNMQEQRKRSNNQVRTLSEMQEPHEVFRWYANQSDLLENEVRKALDSYSASQPLGRWARSICGIGPVIASGLLAHINLDLAPTVGHIWRFSGLDPTVKWEKGKKRPWNAALKLLCWKIGESFVKVSDSENDYYGKLWRERKNYEIARNESGGNADTAARLLVEKKYSNTETKKHLLAGKLPPGQIHARAKRWAVKLFLAHYHAEGLRLLGREVPLPYPIAFLGHVHLVEGPAIDAE